MTKPHRPPQEPAAEPPPEPSATAHEEMKRLHDQHLRALAEFENTKKRLQR